MDRSENAGALAEPLPPPPASQKPGSSSAGSQSRIPPAIFWILGAAIVLRAVTGVLARHAPEGQVGLVRFTPVPQAEVLARTSGKPALYDFTAAWCAPCHKLDTEGWGDSRIASMVNGGFVAIRVVDREREDGKNTPEIEALQKRYSVEAFPTLVAADASGRELARMEGYGGTEVLTRFLEDARQKAQAK